MFVGWKGWNIQNYCTLFLRFLQVIREKHWEHDVSELWRLLDVLYQLYFMNYTFGGQFYVWIWADILIFKLIK